MGVAPIIDFYVIPNAESVAADTAKLNKINSTPASGSSLSSGYDNLGNVALGSNFTIYRQIWNNKNPVSDVSTATDIRFTLHRSMTLAEAQVVQPSATSGEEDGATSPGPANVIVDEGINPPSHDQGQNQWVVGGTGPGASAAAVASELWSSIRVLKQGGVNVADSGGKIGYLLNAAVPSYQFHLVPGSVEITGAQATALTNYITVQIDTTIPNAYTGTGLLYSRLHMEYKFV